jgi:hypothetical protein
MRVGKACFQKTPYKLPYTSTLEKLLFQADNYTFLIRFFHCPPAIRVLLTLSRPAIDPEKEFFRSVLFPK